MTQPFKRKEEYIMIFSNKTELGKQAASLFLRSNGHYAPEGMVADTIRSVPTGAFRLASSMVKRVVKNAPDDLDVLVVRLKDYKKLTGAAPLMSAAVIPTVSIPSMVEPVLTVVLEHVPLQPGLIAHEFVHFEQMQDGRLVLDGPVMHWTVPGEEFTWTPEDTQTQLDKLVGVKNKRQRLAAHLMAELEKPWEAEAYGKTTSFLQALLLPKAVRNKIFELKRIHSK
ncbi:MAG: hypothetical protein E6Q68_06260 [Polynucleobacter sp.]|nr:MAG: hypothetical protein E6Q68_06260 [Polynucleobacter sp.]